MRLLLLLLLLQGCATSASLSKSVPGASSGAQLVNHAQVLGTAWPLQWAGLVALLGGIACLVLGRRATGVTLLLTGLLLAVTPGWLLESLSHVTWVMAGSVAAALLMGVVWLFYKLRRIIKTRQGLAR